MVFFDSFILPTLDLHNDELTCSFASIAPSNRDKREGKNEREWEGQESVMKLKNVYKE